MNYMLRLLPTNVNFSYIGRNVLAVALTGLANHKPPLTFDTSTSFSSPGISVAVSVIPTGIVETESIFNSLIFFRVYVPLNTKC